MTHFRPYRNGDSPALAALWNRAVPDVGTAAPLSDHEFDGSVIGKIVFDAAGLIVAERGGRIVGFAHAGFGPEDPDGLPLRLARELGTIAMLAVEPGPENPELEQGLIAAAGRYLRERGAGVIYAGGQLPLNPFYWGVYGGSEWSGILASHVSFHRAAARAGFEPVSTAVLLEADLSAPDVRDPRAPLIRRQARIEVEEDCLPRNWWEALAVGDDHLTSYSLRSKNDEAELARAETWDMARFGRVDGLGRMGLINMEVPPEHRRKGYGRHLAAEIMRQARGQAVAAVAVQTLATNAPALALYESLGFRPVETAVLYRLPAGRGDFAPASGGGAERS